MNLTTEDRKRLREGMTPGPWVAETDKTLGPATIWQFAAPVGLALTEDMVAQVIGDYPRAEADARVIALAPAMLDRIDELEAAVERTAFLLREIRNHCRGAVIMSQLVEPDWLLSMAEQAIKEIGNDKA